MWTKTSAQGRFLWPNTSPKSRAKRGGGNRWAHGSETCLTLLNLPRLELEVVKGLRAYRYNGAEGIRCGFTELLRCPSSLGVHSQSTFVGLTNGTSHEHSERTNPFLMMQGKFHWPWLPQCFGEPPLSHTPCRAFKLCSQASGLWAVWSPFVVFLPLCKKKKKKKRYLDERKRWYVHLFYDLTIMLTVALTGL